MSRSTRMIFAVLCLWGGLAASSTCGEGISGEGESGFALPPEGNLEPMGSVPPMAVPTPQPDGRFTLRLRDGSKLLGKIDLKSSFQLKTPLGELQIPYDKVVWIVFEEHGGKVRVQLLNGDRVSGQFDSAEFKVVAAWGEAAISSKLLASVTCKRIVGDAVIQSNQVTHNMPDGAAWVRTVDHAVQMQMMAPGHANPYGYPGTPYSSPAPMAVPDPAYGVPARAVPPRMAPPAMAPAASPAAAAEPGGHSLPATASR